jgi:nucleoside-diphosphate-sugar epimerase/predicted O-methyltransferase YrrM
MNVLITGSSGVVGTPLVKELSEKGHNIIEVRHDLRSRGVLDQYFDTTNIDIVIVLACTSVGSKFTFDSSYISDNLRILEYTFETINKYKIPFIYASSQMANMTHNPYAVLKRVGEFYSEYSGGISVKLWNIYGPQKVSSKSQVVSDFIHQAINNREIQMLTDGQEVRQMLHSEDLARALCHIAENYEHCKVSFGNSIDISSFEWISVREIADIVSELVGPNVKVIPGKKTTPNINYNEPRKDFLTTGWKPSVCIREGILDIIKSMNSCEQPVKRIIWKSSQEHMFDMLEKATKGAGDSDKHVLSLFGIAVGSGAKNILELGVRSGVTTLPLLMAAKNNGGKLTSVDINNTHFSVPDDMLQHWKFVQDDAVKFLQNTKETPYDLVFIDDWHAYAHVKKELELLDPIVTPKTIILLHDLMYGNYEPRYHCDLTLKGGQWAEGGPYRAVAELNDQFWEFATLPVNNGLTVLRKKYSSKYYS